MFSDFFCMYVGIEHCTNLHVYMLHFICFNHVGTLGHCDGSAVVKLGSCIVVCGVKSVSTYVQHLLHMNCSVGKTDELMYTEVGKCRILHIV